MTKIFVGNIPFQVTEDELVDAFTDFGDVEQVNIVTDSKTGRSKGYGFITMQNASEAQDAVKILDDSSFHGRNITVNIAKNKKAKPKHKPRHKPRGAKSNNKTESTNSDSNNSAPDPENTPEAAPE
ncbi:MAG: RNA-binding protein [Methylococcales bacterium]|jgi:RNA recognition motif-containing protein|nr:RNA-binding protein [Methylococcales bacterium]MBT7445403.1 RNA-binding protein [Methylococcales bacterium]